MMVVSERIQLLSSWTHVLTADLSGLVFCTLCTRIIFLCVDFLKTFLCLWIRVLLENPRRVKTMT